MTNNFDPFYGEVQYFKGTDLDSFTDPLMSMDGMIQDIKNGCQTIVLIDQLNAPDKFEQMEPFVKEIVKLFQGICYLRLHKSDFLRFNDLRFFDTFTPLVDNDVADFFGDSLGGWNYLIDEASIVGEGTDTPVNSMDFLGWTMGHIRDICAAYQKIVTLRRHGR